MIVENNIIKKESTDPKHINIEVDLAENYSKNGITKNSGPFKKSRDTIVIHYTGGVSAHGAIDALYTSDKEVSAHFVIDEQGKVIQLMPLNLVGWHAGVSEYRGKKYLNQYSIGIEIVNPGYLRKGSGENYFTYFNRKISDPSKAVLARHKDENSERYWHAYEEEQIIATEWLCKNLRDKLGILYIVGHDEISVGRKVDPGPLFPMKEFRDAILNPRKEELVVNQDDDPKKGFVSANLLNIRESGMSNARKVALPLKKGSEVEILEERDGWLKVRTGIEGWVSKEFIDR